MADYKKNPKNPHQIKIPNKISKRFGMTEHIKRINAGSGMSTLAAVFTRKFYGSR